MQNGIPIAYESSGELWTGPSSFDLNSVALRWSSPSTPFTQEALGSGITWALHPSLCERLLPLFPEQESISGVGFGCVDLR